MPEFVPFAAYTRDRSNAVGFQFEFICGRCGNGYMSSFHSLSSLGADAGGVAIKKAAGGLLGRAGGFLGAVGDFAGDKAADTLRDNAKDAALRAAIQEVAPAFAQCPRCRRWVCRRVCFNAAMGLCQDCALQVSAAVQPQSFNPATQPVQPPSGVLPASDSAPQMQPAGMPTYPAPPGQPMAAASMPMAYPAPPSQPFAGGYPQPMGYAPPYGYYPAPAAPVAARTSGLAVTAMIFGIAGIVVALAAVLLFLAAAFVGPVAFIFALLAVIFGHSASGRIRRSQGTLGGSGMAVTGLVLGYIALALSILMTIIGVLALVALSSHLPPSTIPTVTP